MMDANTDATALIDTAKAWRDADPDPVTQAQLSARIEAASAVIERDGDHDGAQSEPEALAALRACFEPALDFGTAGLRGLNGPGPAHMNQRLVARVTAVMVDVLRAEVPDAAERGVVIGYDARHGSAELAKTTARTVAGAGLNVHTFDDYAPTPLVAFAALDLNAAAAVVLTASHNPPEYLGYKLYWADGVQIVPPIDQRIAQALHALPVDVRISQSPQTPGAAPTNPTDPTWHIHGEALRERYRAAVSENATLTRAGAPASAPPQPDTSASSARPVRVAYSAMHGVAGDLLKRTLERVGPMDWHEVSSQAAPNGDFPTVNFPNPEEPGALNHLLELAQRVEADIAIATDPDGDRLALALPDPQGQWQVLMGDQIGLLLTDYRLQQSQHTDESGGRAFVLNTVVSSRLPARVTAAYGADFEQTLTGFKWLWHRALQRQAAGGRFVFAYEDAIGFSPTPRVRDKDGIATAVEVLRLAQTTQASGQTLYDRLNGLYQRYGLSITRQVSLRLDGADATGRMHHQLQTLRQSPPAALAGLPITRVHDYVVAQSRDCDSGRIEPIALPTTNLVQLDLTGPDGDYYISVRPSGTEPKLKIYLEYLGAPGAGGADPLAESAAQSAQLEALAEALNE